MRRASAVSVRALLAGLVAAAGASFAQADTPAINPTTVGTFPSNNGFNYYQGPGNYTFTWDFTANSAISVTQLGYYNSALAGTAEPNGFGSHTLSLADLTTEQTLATTSVTSTNSVTGLFNYAAIQPVTLNTTDTYEVSGTMTTQYYLVGLNDSAAPAAPQINYQFGPLNIFGGPGSPGTYNDFGPNFQFASSSNCTENRAGIDVIALLGDTCTVATGAYSPATTTVTLPVTYNGFGLYAHGGTVNSPGALTIVTSNPNQSGASYGVWADTTGSQINLDGTTSVTTAGDHSHGVYASGGGHIVSTGALSVTTTGKTAIGVYASGAGSTINALLGTISTSGASAAGAQADNGASLTLNGGAIATSGDGAKGLAVFGTGSVLNGSSLKISTSGGVDVTGGHAHGVYNGSTAGDAGGPAGGGTVTLTKSTIATSGFTAYGLVTGNGGSTTMTGGSIATSGVIGDGVYGSSSSTTTLSGVQIATTGDGGKGVSIHGTGTTLIGANVTISTAGTTDAGTGFTANGVFNGDGPAPLNAGTTGGGTVTLTTSTVSTSGAKAVGVLTQNGGETTLSGGAVSTSGVGAYGVVANSGGQATLSGLTISTTGNGSGGVGVGVDGAGSSVTATGVSITTKGGSDPTSGLHAYGLYNGPNNAFAAGGVAKMLNSSISTQGVATFGVYSGAGGATTLTGGSVTTSGADANALYVLGAGASLTTSGVTVATSGANAMGAAVQSGPLTLGDGTQISTSGAGANGLDVSGSNSTATLNGAVALAVTGSATGIAVGDGATVTANGALTIKSAAYGVTIAGAGGEEASGASVNVPGTMSLTTTTGAGAAIALTGSGASFSGTGGGTINAAGFGVLFSNGSDQSASFTNYNITSLAGDLIDADPSTATVAFNSTTAIARSGNLAEVVAGSALTLNANASELSGAVLTQAGAVSNLNLSNGSKWAIDANSAVTHLSLNNSAAGFVAPSGGGFKTLTVTSYTGTGASLTFNALLGTANPAADQIVINGGQATGSTKIFINAIAGAGLTVAREAGGPQTSSSVPLIVTANGGSIAPGAFSLGAPVTAGGVSYTLQQEAGGEFLVGNQGLSPAQASGSLASLAQSRQSQAITNRVLGSILTGATEQINCSSCSSGFASFGSFAFGAHGRWSLSESLALLAGASFDSYSAKGVTVTDSIDMAMSLRYDMVQLGHYRPFFEAGVAVAPLAEVKYQRTYTAAGGGGTGDGEAQSRSAAVYGRAGYIWRLSPVDEAAAYTDFTRSWSSTTGYIEGATGGNPFGALILPTHDSMNVWQTGAQYTHLFGEHIEVNVSAGYALAFDANYGTSAAITGFGNASGAAPSSFDWAELGGRVSYRFSKQVIGDVFALGTVGAEPAGRQLHGGVALRMEF